MSYVRVYQNRINWQNSPATSTPLGATNLNKVDYALYQMDSALAGWDTTKADKSDLLLGLKDVQYNTDTGIFKFTWFNGTTKYVDLNIEKIPVSFSMSPQGIITMTTTDGTQFTADVSSLILAYTFLDSSVIDFTVTNTSSGITVTANIKAGSITDEMLQPQYLADITAQAKLAQSYANGTSGSREGEETDNADYYRQQSIIYSLVAEGFARGTLNGNPVSSSSIYFHNNAKWYAEQAAAHGGMTSHIIKDKDGNTMTPRAYLQFTSGTTTDDPTNDATKVEIASAITDAEWADILAILQ